MKIAVWLLISVGVFSVVYSSDLDDVSFDDVSFDEDNENKEIHEGEEKERVKVKYPQNEDEKRELLKKAMVNAFKRPGAWARLGQVLPVVRFMSPPQRLALASLIMAQVMAAPGEPLPPVSKTENITSQLMLPIAVDIATMFRGMGKDSESEGARSNSYASGLYQGSRISTANGPNIRRPPPTLTMNRRNANVQIDKVSLPRKRPPRPGQRKPSSTTPQPQLPCSVMKNNLCLETKDYPEEAILKSIKNDRNPEAFKALLKEPTPQNISINDANIIERRQGQPAEGKSMCTTTLEFARPKKARATSGQWKYIVNTGDYTQTLRLELCSKPLGSCSYLAEEVESQCQQVYNYHRLLTWDETNGLTMDVFKVPTCCTCRVLGYGGNIFPGSSTEHTIVLSEGPDTNLVANDESVSRLPPPPPPPPPAPTPPLKGIRIRPYSPPKRRPGSVQHRGPPLPLEGENGVKEDIRYPPYENTLRRITRNNTVDRVKFKPHILPPPTLNQRHPALPMDSVHSDSVSVANISPTHPRRHLQKGSTTVTIRLSIISDHMFKKSREESASTGHRSSTILVQIKQ